MLSKEQKKAQTDAKRTKRTGLRYEKYQPRPADLPVGGDCAVRSACRATGESYEEVMKEMQERADKYNHGRHRSILKSGTPLPVIKSFYYARGWSWRETKGELVEEVKYGANWKYYSKKRKNRLFKADNLPFSLCVAITTSHAVAVEDHIVYDSYDSRGDRSCVLEGYFIKKRRD